MTGRTREAFADDRLDRHSAKPPATWSRLFRLVNVCFTFVCRVLDFDTRQSLYRVPWRTALSKEPLVSPAYAGFAVCFTAFARVFWTLDNSGFLLVLPFCRVSCAANQVLASWSFRLWTLRCEFGAVVLREPVALSLMYRAWFCSYFIFLV